MTEHLRPVTPGRGTTLPFAPTPLTNRVTAAGALLVWRVDSTR